MPKNAFGDEVQTNQFGDVVTAAAPSRPSGPSLLSRAASAVGEAASSFGADMLQGQEEQQKIDTIAAGAGFKAPPAPTTTGFVMTDKRGLRQYETVPVPQADPESESFINSLYVRPDGTDSPKITESGRARVKKIYDAAPLKDKYQLATFLHSRLGPDTPAGIPLTQSVIDPSGSYAFGQGPEIKRDKNVAVPSAMRIGVPLATAAMVPETIPIMAGGALGEVLAQGMEQAGGGDQRVDAGKVFLNAVAAGVPALKLTSVVAPGARAAIRAAEGGTMGATYELARQRIEGEDPNLGGAALAGGLGAGIGAVIGMTFDEAARRVQVSQMEAWARSRGFEGEATVPNLRKWWNETGGIPAAPTELKPPAAEPATNAFGDEVMPPSAPAPAPQAESPPAVVAEPVPVAPVAPEPVAQPITQDSSVVERLPHTQEVADSNPAPAPIPEPAPATNAFGDPVAAPAPVEPAAEAAPVPVSDAQIQPPTEPTPEAVGGPAPAPASDVVNEEAGAGSVEPATEHIEFGKMSASEIADFNKMRVKRGMKPGRQITDEERKFAEVALSSVRDERGREYRPAVKTESGKTFAGDNHEQAAREARAAGEKPTGHGFMTPDDRFLSLMEVGRRELGKKVAVPTNATVKATPAGPEITPKPAEDARVSKLADSKQFKVQREFLLDAVRNATKAAPETGSGKVTIEVPGDGTFRVENTKAALTRFSGIVEKRFGKNFSLKTSTAGRIFSPFDKPVEGSRTARGASAIASVPSTPSAENLAAAAKLAVADQPEQILSSGVGGGAQKSIPNPKYVLNNVFQDDGFGISTDGHRITLTAGVGGETAATLKVRGLVYPNWRQVVPDWVLAKNGKISATGGAPAHAFKVATKDALKVLNQVDGVLTEKSNGVKLHVLESGKLGYSANSREVGDYHSDGAGEDSAAITMVNAQYFRDAMVAARLAGHENVRVFLRDEMSPAVVIGGDNFVAVIAPQHMNGPTPISKPAPAPRGAAASPGYASAPPMQPPQAPFRPLRPADDPNFSQLPFQLPEMVQFYRMISGGKNPRILERIRTLHGTALGVFRYIEGNIDSGKIELRADLFHLLSAQEKQKLMNDAVAWAKLMKEANPDMDLGEAIRHKFNELVKAAEEEAMKRDPARAMAVFAHEIGHYIDFLPDATLKRGNVLGHMATLKGYLKNFIGNAPDIFPMPPTSAERAALRRQAEKELNDSVREVTETITREEPIYKTSGITAKMITEVVGQTARDDFPEFYDWFAQLSRAEKVSVLKAAMKGIVDERAARFGKREQIGTKTVTEKVTHPAVEITEEQIRERYRELLREELKKRGLISIQDIKQELEGVIAWWHKRETMPAYFKSGVEMYAETFSVLMNNPAALKERAPTWWKAFEQYLVRKPAVKKAYDQVQNDIKSGAIFTQRVENLRESFHTDEEAGLAWELSRDTNFKDLARYVARRGPEPFWWRELKDSFKLTFINQQAPIEDLARKHLGATKANKLLGAIQDYLYRQTAVEGLGRQINLRVEAPLASQSLTHDDMAEYLFHNRIVNGDAVQTANSQGWSPNTSAQRLEEMRKDLGDVRFNTLKNAVSQFRAIYEEGPLKLLAESRTLKPELMKKILENVAYAPFNVARDAFNPLEVGTIHGMIDAAYGKETTARIFHRIGYLGDIQSPYVALVKKAEILTKFAYKQIAIKSIRDFMTEFEPHLIVQAPKRYNGSRLVPVDRLDNTTGTIYTMDDGEVNGWYVPRTIYETLENATGLEQKLLGWALRFLSPAKAVLTELNFGFWPVNFARDIGAFTIQMRGGVGGLRHLPRAYQAAKASYTSTADPIADQILSRLMVISRADPRGEHLGHPDELNRWLLRLDKHPELWNPEAKKIGRLLRLWEWYKSRGQILERTVKTMGMMTVDALHGIPAPDENTPWVTMPEPLKREIVHELAGSPNFPKRGRGIAFVEVSGKGMFANAWMRGIEAFYKAQKRDPAGVWPKFLLFIGLPTLAAFLYYEMGWNPPGTDPKKNEEDRDMMRSVPERDKLRGVIHLLGWADKAQKKVAYVILPFPEQPRMLNAAFRKTLQTMAGQRGQKLGLESWLQYQGQDLPSKNPYLDAADKWWQLEVLNQNPYDSFRGKGMLDDDVAKAGQGAGQLARDTLASVTGGMIPQPIPNVPGSNPTELEKFLHLPVVGNLVGRWVRVSNAGVSELDAAAVQPTDQQAAVLRILGNQLLTKIENNVPFTDNEMHVMATETYLFDYMAQRFTAYQAGALGPEVRDFLKGTTQERGALIKMWAERSAAKQARLQAAGAGPN